MESPILINVWTVDSSQRAELVKRVIEVTREQAVKRPGFISAQLYESNDGGTVVGILRMRTAKDRQDLMDSPEAQRAFRELRTFARDQLNLYRIVESFGEPE
jgi:hypothetical protein